MKNKVFIITAIIAIFSVQFVSAQTPRTTVQEVRVSTARNTTLINGFRSHATNYETVNIDGRTNVIKINGRDCDWAVLSYQLDAYRGKLITIRFSADVMLTGAGENWQCLLNNEPDYPAIARLGNPVPGVWNHMSGTLIVMPSNRNPLIHINTYGNDIKNTTYYFDNISLTIETWDYTPASALASAGEAGSNNTRNIYVSASRGADSGNGTQARPFAKIAHAMYYVKPGDTVLVDSGTYYEKFRMPSGSSGRPVTLTAMPNAEVIITPTIQITPQWRQHNKNIWVADISEYVSQIDTEFPQLFADRDSMVEARFPNMGASMSMMHDYIRDIAGKGTNKNTVVASKNIPAGIIGARVVICPGQNRLGWETATSIIQSIKGKTITLATDITVPDDGYYGNAAYTPSQGNPFYITGALALLDAPGEYYFDKNTSQLYFYPPWNGRPDSHTLALRSKNEIAIHAENTSFININNVTVYGGSIFMKNNRNSTLENCKVNYAEHFYFIGNSSASDSLYWSRTDRMIVSGSNNRIQRCEFGPTAGHGIVLQGDDNIFTNNIIHNTSYIGFPYGGLAVKQSKRLEISRNTMTNSAHSHIIFIETGNFKGQKNRVDYERCIIRNNYLENHATLNSDGGAFYTGLNDGGGTEIYNNFIVCGNKNNQGAFDKLRMGLYADNHSLNYIFRNNILIGGEDGLAMNLPCAGVKFINNTVVGANNGITMYNIQSDPADASTSFFTDNLFVNTKANDIVYWGTEDGRSTYIKRNFDNGTVPVPIRPDWRVQSSGNARGTVDAQYRPTGNTPDIGAIPRGGEMFPYGADWKIEERR